MSQRSGYPGSQPAPQAGLHLPAKNRGGGGQSRPAPSLQTPHGSAISSGCALGDDTYSHYTGYAKHWPTGVPETWERTAVNVAKCSPAEKNRAWRRLKSETPDVAQAIASDLPALRKHFPGATVYVAADYIEGDEHG